MFTMTSFPVICLLCGLLAQVEDAEGFRFKYNRRLNPANPRYTPYAYSNYISYSPTKGWEQSSSYVKYVPDVRYSRTYKFYHGQYSSYINMYFSMASSDTYKNRFIPSDALVCANYDANDKGDVMGIFTCPNAWEPRNFTTCCGQDYAEFCCDQKPATSKWVTAVAAVGGILAAIIIIVVIVVCCVKKRKDDKPDDRLAFSAPHMEVSQPVESSVKSQQSMVVTSAKDTAPFAYSTAQ